MASASINWGDTTSSAGTINGSGPYTVRGTHTYADPGSYTVTTTVATQDSSTRSTFTSAASGHGCGRREDTAGGAFVIGDKSGQFGNSGSGSDVDLLEPVVGHLQPHDDGTAPSSFKGWENSVVQPAVRPPVPQWQSKTGNTRRRRPARCRGTCALSWRATSARPDQPAGNVARIVIVDTQGNAYNPNPASNGAGKVVRVECTS